MPRKRTVGATQAPQGMQADSNPPYGEDVEGVQVQAETNTNSTNNGVTKGEKKLMGLTADQIQALLGAARTKGAYLTMLNEFIASGEAGVCANDEWIALKEKKATTISQGFKNAKDNKAAADGAEFVSILTNDDKIYLINLKAAGEVDPEAAELAEAAA